MDMTMKAMSFGSTDTQDTQQLTDVKQSQQPQSQQLQQPQQQSADVFFTENIEKVSSKDAYIFKEIQFSNGVLEYDVVLNGGVVKYYTSKYDEIINLIKYLQMQPMYITTDKPTKLGLQINEPVVLYHANDFRINHASDFMNCIDTILNLPMRAISDVDGIHKSYYPNILIFGKEKVSVKLPVHMSIQDNQIWEYYYLIDYNGKLNFEILNVLKQVYPETITEEFIDKFTSSYEAIVNSPRWYFSLSYYSFLRKLYSKYDICIKALVNVMIHSEVHNGYTSEYYRIFHESRMQDTEEDDSNGCSQFKYKGFFMPVTFKDFLGGSEMIDGVKRCPALEALNEFSKQPDKRNEMLNDIKEIEDLLPISLYLYHMGNTNEPDKELMRDYDKYESNRQDIAKHIWFYHWCILMHEACFADAVGETFGSFNSKESYRKQRPFTWGWNLHNCDEELRITTYKRRKQRRETI